ncbi:helicase SNF2 (plasmid) [Deinococcus psychrotolerans]|uniref:Helicase SNF2 n=1 Tax=Deinococcus psychrotolerans TaxID=2489213 RepID=A0A3G8YJM7_9DEIO|nr:phospholipase D-like domain-containing anti-phage protein [Deinococcus psychrotolerans]AZI45163.1 helicase SNF2 [Deinococcus psychrotolerans]
MTVRRFSSRRERLDKAFLSTRLEGAASYDRIAGYFNSSLLDLMAEQLEAVSGTVRVICNSDLDPADVQTAKAAAQAQRLSWVAARPETLLVGEQEQVVRGRLARLYKLLIARKLEVRVLPDEAFGLVHGKAGVIRYDTRPATCFMGSTNESRRAWRDNYELVWEDTAPDAVAWVQEEFDALWNDARAVALADAVIEDVGRLANRTVISLPTWQAQPTPAAAIIETPVYRRENGLWAHQKAFVELVMNAHHGPTQKARFVLADQVGLGKTVQLAMCAQLIALSGTKPVLIICPKTLLWQWQAEMLGLLDVPSAVWNGENWVDEAGAVHPANVSNALKRCPRRIGIVSSGLISRGSEAAQMLLSQDYDLVVLDEAHRARRKNSGEGKESQAPDANNLMRFMLDVASRSRSVLLATATPVQLGPIEAWDLLNILAQGDDSVLGTPQSLWRKRPAHALELVMNRIKLPADDTERWQWFSNPLPPAQEHPDFAALRRSLSLSPAQSVAPPQAIHSMALGPGDRRRLQRFPSWMHDHHPFIRRIVLRSRKQLEEQKDEFGQPILQPIKVVLHGEREEDALRLPGYLQDAYELAEKFTRLLGARMRGAGFLKTLLLRRVGSTLHAGRLTAQRLLGDWGDLNGEDDEDEAESSEASFVRALTGPERSLLEQFVDALEREQSRDPKLAAVTEALLDWNWLEEGCIIFSQYRDSVAWLGEQLTAHLPGERIALYSGPTTSGIYHVGTFTPTSRDELKRAVQSGEIRLLLGTDAASEGLNLQRLSRLINLDLPWNPTRLEQRKGRIQRIGQRHDAVHILNLRYRGSVEDRVHARLSERLNDIRTLFGQIPDVLEDVWIQEALGQAKRAQQVIDAVPTRHAFEIRNAEVKLSHWEGCTEVLNALDVQAVLRKSWSERERPG